MRQCILHHTRAAVCGKFGSSLSLIPYRTCSKNILTFQCKDILFRNMLCSSVTFYRQLLCKTYVNRYTIDNWASITKLLSSVPYISRIRNYSSSTQNTLSFSNAKIQQYLSYLKANYEKSLELTDVDSVKISRNLHPLMELLNKMESVKTEIVELHELAKDGDSGDEMQQLAKNELQEAHSKLQLLEDEVLTSLTPSEPLDNTDIVIEVCAGVGGQEAMLFCQEVFDMYISYADYMGWQAEIHGLEKTDIGGLRHGEVCISGEGAYKLLKYEGGIHRVQRVPKTEKAGRIHTSTVSVAVMPQPSEIDIQIATKDLKIETKRASGAGGQHVNTTDSAIRILHIPSGITVECQKERSQHKNKEEAMKKLRTLLYQRELDENMSQYSSSRRLQVGTKARSEKIRTYNYPQDRITDHRIGISIHNLPSLLEGSEALHSLITQVIREAERESLLEIINSIPATDS